MDDIKPSRWYYALAAAIIIAGGAIFFYYLSSGIESLDEGLTQIVVPGEGDIILKEGQYTIFYENESVVDGRIYSFGRDISGLQIELKNKSTGISVPLQASRSSITYNLGGRYGRSVLEFHIDKPGIYELSGRYPGGTGPDAVIAVGSGVFGNIMWIVVAGIVIYLGSILAGIAMVVVVYRKRKDAMRRLEEEADAIRGRRIS